MKNNSTMKNTRLFFFYLFILSLFIRVSQADAKIYVDVTAPGMKLIPIAAPYLNPKPENPEAKRIGVNIAEVLTDDLLFHGYFSVPDPQKYGGSSDYEWKRLGVNYVASGTLYLSGQAMIVDYKLTDVADNSVIVQKKYSVTPQDYRQVAHEFCDEIIFALTGERSATISRIAFVLQQGMKKDIFTADFDGWYPKKITDEKSLAISPRFSPDGKKMLFTSYRYGKPQIFVKDLPDGQPKRILEYPGLNISPAWHPSGDRLAVTLSKDGNPDIYLVSISGQILEKLTFGPGMNVSPSFSPDGKKMAFVSDRGGTPQVYIMDMTSRTIKRLTFRGSYNTDPQWSPKGDMIVYTGRTDGQFQIFTISADGGEPMQLTSVGSNENPCWAPNGRMILFISNRTGRKELYAMTSAGIGQKKIITQLLGDVSQASWGRK